MPDIILVIVHFFNWKFFLVLAALIALGLWLPERRTRVFRSVRFNIYLFTVIAIASSVGTLMPMEQASKQIYHTWWFASLLALMAFDVVTCKLRGLPGQPEKFERMFANSKMRSEFVTPLSPDSVLKRAEVFFAEKKMRTQSLAKSGRNGLQVGWHRIQRWGDFILHVSIVVGLAGSLMGAMFGFEEMLPIEEGATVRMKNRPLDVTLTNFDIEYYKGTGAPSVYASELVVKENGQEVAQRRIVVNEPLDIKRLRFYQASWGMTTNFNSALLHVAGQNMIMKPGEAVPIAGTDLAIRANEFLPSFTIDTAGRANTTDYEGKNPALQVDFLQNGDVKARVWLQQHNPRQAFQINGDKLTPAAPPPFFLVDVDPVLFSGIQAGFDPGAPLFWFGSIWLMIGLCMHFYFHQRRLRVEVQTEDGGTRVTVIGWNSRVPSDFEKEFRTWAGQLKTALE
jgi:cytochrome c biogenesis protein